MAKYCPIMSYQCQGRYREECLGKECAWADKNGNCLIAKALKQTGGKLTTIEYYDKRQSVAIENFKKCGVNDIIRPLQGSACELIEALDPNERFDFVFIDANKKEYIQYFELAEQSSRIFEINELYYSLKERLLSEFDGRKGQCLI